MIGFLRFLWSWNRRGWVIAVSLSVLVSLTEGLALLVFLPMFGSFGISIQNGQTGTLADFFLRVSGVLGLQPSLTFLLATFLFLMMLHETLYLIRANLVERLVQDVQGGLRGRAYAASVWTGWRTYMQCRVTDLIYLLTGQIEEIGQSVRVVLTMTVNLSIALVYLTLAMWISPTMTFVAIGASICMITVVGKRARTLKNAGRSTLSSQSELYNITVEHQRAAKTSRASGLESESIRLFREAVTRVQATRTRAVWLASSGNYLFKVGAAAALCLILYVAIEGIHVPPADLIFLVVLFSRLMPKLSLTIDDAMLMAHWAPVYTKALQQIENFETRRERTEGREQALVHRHSVEFVDVIFGFPGAQPCLAGINFRIAYGEQVAVIGGSGVGKSTLVDILLGLLSPDRGEVLIDGVSLNGAMLTSWRREIGYVGQESFLFDGTVRENLCWASPVDSDEKLWQALDDAAAKEFVSALPLGLDTVLGERGVQLSGGQRQRISIARAFLRAPRLLVLDEATNELDYDNERKILDRLERLRGRATVVIVSHRMTTVQRADKVLLLKDHKVEDLGKFGEHVNRAMWGVMNA